jgi:conjugative relaxase-like TrwC/TraI family protein
VVAQIVAEETARSTRRAVAGFDFTFSIPKSASVLWAVADAGVQALIAEAHHRAVAEVVAFMEREVAATRTGATAGDGAVAQVDVTGLIATAFDHFDSRAGDPHLHTPVVISNKAKTVLDGKWRSLDGRPMHAAVVALSELHEAVFADHMTRTFGVSWEEREMGRDHNPAWAIAGVSEELIAEFSTRARHIDAETDYLIAEYVEAHGRRPTPAAYVYAGSKTAVTHWMRTIGVTPEWAGKGIRVNAIAPGAVMTPLLQKQLDDPKLAPGVKSFPIPVGEFGKREEIAQWVIFMLSPAANFMCGSVVFLDGGTDAYFRADDWPRAIPQEEIPHYFELIEKYKKSVGL